MGKKEEKFNDYDGFMEKFKPKKTTDDCYTPPCVYDAVLDWVKRNADIKDRPVVRPFYRSGLHENRIPGRLRRNRQPSVFHSCPNPEVLRRAKHSLLPLLSPSDPLFKRQRRQDIRCRRRTNHLRQRRNYQHRLYNQPARFFRLLRHRLPGAAAGHQGGTVEKQRGKKRKRANCLFIAIRITS